MYIMKMYYLYLYVNVDYIFVVINNIFTHTHICNLNEWLIWKDTKKNLRSQVPGGTRIQR